MRRALTVVCTLACVVAPGAATAEVPGYTAIGRPATLNSLVYASDGTIYGTVDGTNPASTTAPVVLWRSRDHGSTWSAVYRLPYGYVLRPVGASPADPSTVYAVQSRLYADSADIVRIDARSGRSVPLPLGYLEGIDSAGTAYGRFQDVRTRAWSVVRCRRLADACDQVALPAGLAGVIVDPNAAGVLVSPANPATATTTTLFVSTDGGTTWNAGGQIACCALQFAGPGAQTLYSRTADALVVSHDAGRTWSAPRPMPAGSLAVGDAPTASFWRVASGPYLVSADEGATTHALTAPIDGQLLVDPSDARRMLIAQGDDTRLSADGGATWRSVTDPRFGVAALDAAAGRTAGSGTYIYSAASGAIWSSGDSGRSWTSVERPAGEHVGPIIVSRDDPRTAYAATSATDAAGVTTYGGLRTRDGGATWQATAVSEAGAVDWIAPGDPLHVFAVSSQVGESHDGGATWVASPQADWCIFEVWQDTSSPTGSRLRCAGFYQGTDPLRPLPSPVPFAPGLVASPDLPGSVVIALPGGQAVVGHQTLLGEIRADWAWDSLLVPTAGFGPSTPGADAVTAWPSPAGTTFYAFDAPGTTWARRGAGRWWRVRVGGRDVSVLSALSATRALVAFPPNSIGERGILDLAQPSLAAPAVTRAGGTYTCTVPWTAADAETTGYAWLRDGVPVAGAGGATLPAVPGDEARAIACRVTARTDFGASTVTSESFGLPQSARAWPSLTLSGIARPGRTLRCGAAVRITWFRDGKALKGRHARTLLVRRGDRGHTLTCQTRRPDGTLSRSRAARIGRP
jgi:hypothetical protein